MAKIATIEHAPRLIPRRGHDGRVMDHFVDVEVNTFEDALERAAQLGRIARLVQKGLDNLETDKEEDDQDILATLMWASARCLEAAIEFHNAQVPKPEDPPSVTRLRRKEAE